MKDKTGNLLANKADVLNRFVEYFDELLNGDSDSPPPTLHTIYGPNPESLTPPTLSEIEDEIGNMKNHKCPGSDGILAEMLKSGGEVLVEHIHKIITDI